ncbi:MAG TPA: PAS domain-containing protein [Anaerolineaceae bacterium]|nr:PAS domain-containing protein [Anaerolineaceae bacterium]
MISQARTILLIEDDPDDHLLIHDLLLEAGFTSDQILWAPTYQKGIEQITLHSVDVVLIDYYLGAKTGVDFILEATHLGIETPIILLTGTSSKAIDLEGMNAGATDYLEKAGINARSLERALRYAVERRRLQAEVNRQGKTLRSIFELDPGALAIVAGKDLTFRYVNPAYQAILPNPNEDPINRSYLQVWESDDRIQELAAIRAALEGKPIDIDRVPHPMPDGSVRFFSSRIRGIDWEGEPAVLLSLWDVTSIENANQRAESAAIEAERRALEAETGKRILDALMTYIPEGVAVADTLKGKISLVSRYGKERLNAQLLPSNELEDGRMVGAGKFFHVDGCTPADKDELPLARAIHKGEVIDSEEWTLRSENQKDRFIECNAGPIYDKNGSISGGVITWRDITERIHSQQAIKDAYEALQDSHNRFRVALQNSLISVYTNDRDLRYTWVYHPLQDLQSEDILGKRDDEIYPKEIADKLIHLKRTVLQTGQGVREELCLVDSPGERIFDLTIEPLLDSTGAVVGLTVSAMDVTERRRIEEERTANSTMLEVQRLLGQQQDSERMKIARDLHDGPLQQLIGATYGLTEAMEIYEKEARLAKLIDIRNQLQQEIRDLRAFCSELRPPTLAPFGVEKAIRSHVDSILERTPDISIHLDLTPDGQTLSEDIRMALFRIYQELMNNVIRHSRANQVTISQWFEDECVVLDVQDNGVGFSVPDRWIDLARQGHLGLVGLLERAEAVGGRVQITSSVGQGTQVRVRIPQQPLETLG